MIDLNPPVSTQAGQNVTIICRVTVVEGLIRQPTVKWLKSDGNKMTEVTQTTTVTEGANTTLTLSLDPIQYGDGGIYICTAETDLTLIRGKPDFEAYGAASKNYTFIVTCEQH